MTLTPLRPAPEHDLALARGHLTGLQQRDDLHVETRLEVDDTLAELHLPGRLPTLQPVEACLDPVDALLATRHALRRALPQVPHTTGAWQVTRAIRLVDRALRRLSRR